MILLASLASILLQAPQAGVLKREPDASPGYTLFAPLRSTTTWLVDLDGTVVHRWDCDAPPGQSVYLLEDGTLLRTARSRAGSRFRAGGEGGRVQRLAPDGTVLWDFLFADDQHRQHHDVEPLPGGNVLLIAWERIPAAKARAAGRDPALLRGGEMWSDFLVEVEPVPPDGGRIVWEWHAWDHLVQDRDPEGPGYGLPREHPERIDVNWDPRSARLDPRVAARERDRLEELGYAESGEDEAQPRRRRPPGGRGGPPGFAADWLHVNSVDYDAAGDRIALSVHGFNEIWIVDHGTTTEEASASSGGRRGRGGDLLYRWGNPQAWGAGGAGDQRLFGQHDVHWIPDGLAGAGHLLYFNNGSRFGGRPYSSVEEIELPLGEDGALQGTAEGGFGPGRLSWQWVPRQRRVLFSERISGAQRLPNGNTLACFGEPGRLVEVTPEGSIVWDYRNPFRDSAGDGRGPGRGPGGGAVFRATRYAPDHPGIRALLAAADTPTAGTSSSP